MSIMSRYSSVIVTASVVTLTILFMPTAVQADRPVAGVSGGGTALFVEGSTGFGLTTQFSVGATVSDDPDASNPNCGLSEGADLGAGYNHASGHFFCAILPNPFLPVPADPNAEFPIPLVTISGKVHQGRVNGDGSITLCGIANGYDMLFDAPFKDLPFAVTLRDNNDSFTYWDAFIVDVLGQVQGDTEEVVKGKIKIRIN